MPVHAALNIEIFGGGATQIPIAIVPFAAEETLRQSITPVVGADFSGAGYSSWSIREGSGPMNRWRSYIRIG